MFGFRKKRDCTICVAKTKALISFAVTAKLICVFVFAYAKSRFSNDEAQTGRRVIVALSWHNHLGSRYYQESDDDNMHGGITLSCSLWCFD